MCWLSRKIIDIEGKFQDIGIEQVLFEERTPADVKSQKITAKQIVET